MIASQGQPVEELQPGITLGHDGVAVACDQQDADASRQTQILEHNGVEAAVAHDDFAEPGVGVGQRCEEAWSENGGCQCGGVGHLLPIGVDF